MSIVGHSWILNGNSLLKKYINRWPLLNLEWPLAFEKKDFNHWPLLNLEWPLAVEKRYKSLATLESWITTRFWKKTSIVGHSLRPVLENSDDMRQCQHDITVVTCVSHGRDITTFKGNVCTASAQVTYADDFLLRITYMCFNKCFKMF